MDIGIAAKVPCTGTSASPRATPPSASSATAVRRAKRATGRPYTRETTGGSNLIGRPRGRDRAYRDPALDQRADPLWTRGAEQRRHLGSPQQVDVLPLAAGAEAPVRAAQRDRHPVGEGQERVRVQGEGDRRRLHVPA